MYIYTYNSTSILSSPIIRTKKNWCEVHLSNSLSERKGYINRNYHLFFFSLCIHTYSFENIIIDIRTVTAAINRHIYIVHIHTLIETTTRSEAVSDSVFFSIFAKMKEIEMSIKNKVSFNTFWESLEKRERMKKKEMKTSQRGRLECFSAHRHIHKT